MQAGRFPALLVAAGLALAAAAAPAGADPKKGGPVTLVCDNGHTYTTVVNGNGDFTPAHDVNGTATLVPLSFGDFTGTVTDSGGNVVDSFTELAFAKGESGKRAKNTVGCTFSINQAFEDQGETFTVTGSGSVVGFITPRNGA